MATLIGYNGTDTEDGSNHSALTAVTELYLAYFNRAPDASGLDYWASAINSGSSLAQVATSFSTTPEFLAAYGNVTSNSSPSVLTDFITAVYQNVLDRAPDSGGQAYWLNALETNQVTPATFLLDIVNAVQGQNGTADAIYLSSKEAVGYHFAVTDGLTNATQSAAVMTQFNTTYSASGASAAVFAANTASDGYLAHVSTTPELVVHLVGVTTA